MRSGSSWFAEEVDTHDIMIIPDTRISTKTSADEASIKGFEESPTTQLLMQFSVN